MKRIFYIFILIIGLNLNSDAQVKSAFVSNDAIKTVKFYPNPATSYINFEFDKPYDNSYTLLIFNFIGKKIAEIKVTDQKITIPLIDYFRGIYVFQLRDKLGDIIESGKFQVVK